MDLSIMSKTVFQVSGGRMTEKPVAEASLAKTHFLAQRPIIVVAVLALAAVAITLAHVQGLQSHLVSIQALQNARLFTGALAEFRTVYTSEVVERIRPSGIEIAHDYQLREGAAPLPATLSMMLGSRIAELELGGGSRLYSPYLFPWRIEDGGLADDFAREAWAALLENPEEPFCRFETLDGRDVLRYATADLMRSACVDCHNTHPDTPKSDWKEGDVRGVLDVITPLDAPLAATHSGLVDTAMLMLFMAALGLLLFGVMMSYFQAASTEAATLVAAGKAPESD
jgi:adenylate cyclase